MCTDKNWTPGASECDPGDRERRLIAGAVITNCKGATAERERERERVNTDRREDRCHYTSELGSSKGRQNGVVGKGFHFFNIEPKS